MRKYLRLKIVEHFDTQERFSKESGLDESIISKLVRGIRNPTPEQEEQLVSLLKTPSDELFKVYVD